jgi:hypothetical protein
VEKPINQRIKFLLEALSLSARDFSRAVGVPDNNTQNYLEPRFAQPKADYLEKVVLHFESINPIWLLTGKGEPFLSGAAPTINTGTATQHITLEACQRELEAMKRDAASYQREIELLKGQLEDKNEIIILLRGGYNRTN